MNFKSFALGFLLCAALSAGGAFAFTTYSQSAAVAAVKQIADMTDYVKCEYTSPSGTAVTLTANNGRIAGVFVSTNGIRSEMDVTP